ncbi:hypothetical protein O181_014052 [Austropuccinia psidii MF-1]|uniref:Uncharacterized protein n=1 Tax=Austropuccinia psidii MF-1 TaxID=1389203 RepID=A0A9Q3BZG9_9BASI|nr:hypothetical protein [Austropuccinia psidii MF-1]
MDVTLELDTRYHERQKEKGGNQEKKPHVIGSNPSRPPQCSSSKKPHYKKNKKGKQFQSSKDKPHASLLNKDKKLICSENERRIKEGSCSYCCGKHPIENASREPRKSLDNQEASLASREKPDILIDYGATNSFIEKNFALKYSLTVLELPEKIPIFILDSNEFPALFIPNYTKWVIDFPSSPSFEWDFFIIDSPKGEDLILGYDFLYHFKAVIYWKNGLITRDSSGINSSTSNDLATAVHSVALVGELKKPSLPSSVHIPSIMPSQSLLV